MSINPQQARALQALRKAMALATDSGLFEITFHKAIEKEALAKYTSAH